MVYEVPDPKKSIYQNRFEFTVGGKAYWLPKAKYLTGAQAEMIRPDDGPAQIFGTISPDTKTRDVIMSIPVADLEPLLEAWQAESGVTLPELEDSAG